MAYARMTKDRSDVYVYMSGGNADKYPDGYLSCHCCAFVPMDGYYEFRALSTAAMVTHLEEHIAAGHLVPDYVIADLWADDAESFPAPVAGK